MNESSSTNKKIRITFYSYDHEILDVVVEKIFKAIINSGAETRGPARIKSSKKIITIHRSPFVFEESKIQMMRKLSKRVLDVMDFDKVNVESILSYNHPSVKIKMKVLN